MPRALDLFCGAGGAGMGLHRAGFDVVGVDIEPQPRYPFTFIQGDALRPPVDLSTFDFIWASPMCHRFCSLKHQVEREYPNQIPETRALLKAGGAPYAIENVIGAPLDDPVMLCGSFFGLLVRRHRAFEASFPMFVPECSHRVQGKPIGVHGTGGNRKTRRTDDRGGQANMARNIAEASAAMGIDWMTRREIAKAVPPAYSEFIGRQAMRYIETRRAA